MKSELREIKFHARRRQQESRRSGLQVPGPVPGLLLPKPI